MERHAERTSPAVRRFVFRVFPSWVFIPDCLFFGLLVLRPMESYAEVWKFAATVIVCTKSRRRLLDGFAATSFIILFNISLNIVILRFFMPLLSKLLELFCKFCEIQFSIRGHFDEILQRTASFRQIQPNCVAFRRKWRKRF